jgi:DNA-binding XRE family transcriptional regulator
MKDYSKLKGKIVEVYGSQEKLAKVLDLSNQSMSNKMTNKVPFKTNEIEKLVELLGIDPQDIGVYFFKKKVE